MKNKITIAQLNGNAA